MISLKSYITNSGEEVLYSGTPNFKLLDELVLGSGDVWHSSLDQGYKNCFPELIYQTAVYWWFLNDIENKNVSVNWRINPASFVVRKSVWNLLKGFDTDYKYLTTSGLDFGYNLLRNNAGIPLYVKGLFKSDEIKKIKVNRFDRYLFFRKNFKNRHSYYMLFRKGIFNSPLEIYSFYKAKNYSKRKIVTVKPKELQPIQGKPTVSLVIPTMKRQAYSQLLLNDHKKQTYLIKEAVIVDATPANERDEKYYRKEDFPFDIKVKWQTTKGSCRARNEAIEMCTGDYIIFADDDIRILSDFVENHIRLLQTYNVSACNGLDIMAENMHQDTSDLINRLDYLGQNRWKVGISPIFSNANSCVRKEVVNTLKGNDVNFDGGYGEDADFGIRILKLGEILLHNPYSPNLHLKPPQGGYRWWGSEAGKKGKNRKKQPWELDKPVKNIRPIPSPTITYGLLKHFKKSQICEWKLKYFFLFLFKKELKYLPIRIIQLPLKWIQFNKSIQYAKALINLSTRFK